MNFGHSLSKGAVIVTFSCLEQSCFPSICDVGVSYFMVKNEIRYHGAKPLVPPGAWKAVEKTGLEQIEHLASSRLGLPHFRAVVSPPFTKATFSLAN